MSKYKGSDNRMLSLILQMVAPQEAHHRIHHGEMFYASHYFSAVADDAFAGVKDISIAPTWYEPSAEV